jgi:hypothetical protein
MRFVFCCPQGLIVAMMRRFTCGPTSLPRFMNGLNPVTNVRDRKD